MKEAWQKKWENILLDSIYTKLKKIQANLYTEKADQQLLGAVMDGGVDEKGHKETAGMLEMFERSWFHECMYVKTETCTLHVRFSVLQLDLKLKKILKR